MRENARERTEKYLQTTSRSLERFKMTTSESPITSSVLDQVLDLARGYQRDSRHYLDDNKPVTALACISYAEGLIDALKFLNLAEF